MAEVTKEIQKKPATATQEAEWTRNGKVYTPRTDIYETKDAIVILAEMPGVDEQTASVTLEKGILTIQGTVAPETHDNAMLTYSEYETGNYYRAFSLSDEVDKEKIEASVKNGVLKLVLHKAEPAKAKVIQIAKA